MEVYEGLRDYTETFWDVLKCFFLLALSGGMT